MGICIEDPVITQTERDGSISDFGELRYIGECANPNCKFCHNVVLYDDYECFEDGDDNLFCSEESFKAFYGFRLHEV